MRGDEIALIAYNPSLGVTERFDLSVPFIIRVLQCAEFLDLRLPAAIEHIMSDAGRCEAVSQLRQILSGKHRLDVLRHVVSYTQTHGTREPDHSMIPRVIADAEREKQEHEADRLAQARRREHELVVKVQSRVRQLLARRTRLQLALVGS